MASFHLDIFSCDTYLGNTFIERQNKQMNKHHLKVELNHIYYYQMSFTIRLKQALRACICQIYEIAIFDTQSTKQAF